jgi:hypothetical protein
VPLLLGCFAVLFPRLALVLVWIFGPGYLESSYPSRLWLLLGFLFLPLTTLAFAFVSHSMAPGGSVSTFGWLLTGVAVLVDVGIVGRSRSHYRRSREA